MWLIHRITKEEGWHICQENQTEPCNLLVFVKEEGFWRMKLWKSEETYIRAKNYSEQMKDEFGMQFPLRN
jgi:hypothetical protein